MSLSVSVLATSEAETGVLAARVAPLLRPGDVLCLRGDLGAGKTTFTRALVRALGSPASVSSPTFTLVHEYPGGRFPIVHIDAYRLENALAAEEIGWEEYVGRGDAVMIVEWPQRIAEILPAERLEIEIEETSSDHEEQRRFTVTPHGDRWRNIDWQAVAC